LSFSSIHSTINIAIWSVPIYMSCICALPTLLRYIHHFLSTNSIDMLSF
jgi:hypothetical protein